MRTTLTLDDDVAGLIEAERRRTGETLRQTVNRLLRRSVNRTGSSRPELPIVPGDLAIDISDVSRVLGEFDDERWLESGFS
ncbi:MAG: hypothetical protein ACREA0_24750 [bacterium]